jgi:hypothetical protein
MRGNESILMLVVVEVMNQARKFMEAGGALFE